MDAITDNEGNSDMEDDEYITGVEEPIATNMFLNAWSAAKEAAKDVVVEDVKGKSSCVSGNNSLKTTEIEVVHLFVGEGENMRHLKFDKNLLCAKVHYFHVMFNGPFIESKGEAHLPKDSPEGVEQLLNILLFHEEDGIASLSNAPSRSLEGVSWNPVEIYSLAQKWCLFHLLDDIMDAVMAQHFWKEELPSIAFIRDTYDKTPEDCMLRKYVIWATRFARGKGDDFPACMGCKVDIPLRGKEWEKLLEDYPDFYEDFKEIEPAQWVDPRALLNRCEFHIHVVKNPCSGRRMYNRHIR